MGKRCIVYGGGGFIGSHLCEELLGAGCEVTVFDKLNFSVRNIEHLLGSIKVLQGDFSNPVDIKTSLEGIDVVYHLVSSTLPASSNENPVYDAETNLISSLRLFRLCTENKIRKVIFLSSGGTVYGIPDKVPIREDHSANPVCSYGIIKKAIEDYLYLFNYLHGLDYTVFRLSNPYGERQNPNAGQGVIAVFLNKIIRNEEIVIWGDGEVVRDYIYIKDAVRALAASAGRQTPAKVFNLSYGTGVSLNGLLDIMKRVSGKSGIKVNYLPKRSFDVPVSVLDNGLIHEQTGWMPVTKLEDGIAATYEYLRNLND